jgi:hypothetical protein
MGLRFPLHLEILANESVFRVLWPVLSFAQPRAQRMIHVGWLDGNREAIRFFRLTRYFVGEQSASIQS